MSCFSRVLYLEEGNVGEDNVVWVSDLKKDLLSVVVTFTTQDFTSNTPTLDHDFATIERTVGSRLCAFKPLIRMKVSLVFILYLCFCTCTEIFYIMLEETLEVLTRKPPSSGAEIFC